MSKKINKKEFLAHLAACKKDVESWPEERQKWGREWLEDSARRSREYYENQGYMLPSFWGV